MLVAGPGPARGCGNAPELTAVRFPNLPDSARACRTGGWVRQLPDEAVEFLSRISAQVKIRGHRVAPGQVEAALLRHPRLAQAAVIAVAEASGEVRPRPSPPALPAVPCAQWGFAGWLVVGCGLTLTGLALPVAHRSAAAAQEVPRAPEVRAA